MVEGRIDLAIKELNKGSRLQGLEDLRAEGEGLWPSGLMPIVQ